MGENKNPLTEQGEEIEIAELSKRVYSGENLLSNVLALMFDSEYKELILKAAKLNMPMTIYDDCQGGDGLLYRALKNAGVKTVRSFQIDKEINKGAFEHNNAFFTIYLNKPMNASFFNSSPV